MSFRSEAEPPSPEGAAFPWILEHLLAYPGTYEIPLRTMYTLNSNTQTPPTQSAQLNASRLHGNAFPRTLNPAADDQYNMSTATAAAQLRANLMTHIAQLPSQPSSLPPSFVISFMRRCFPPELDRVDFPQALTALDYLKDLEVRRRREVVAALDRLGVDRNDLTQKEVLRKKYPGVLRWVLNMEEKERKVEASYTQVYIGLRRWTLINELSLIPFNKSNCIAMLNTLYPPTTIHTAQFVQPTSQLTPAVLASQRNGFFRYVTAVEKNGPGVLRSLMDQHKRPEDATGWLSVRETLDNYLHIASAIIDECFEVTGRDSSAVASTVSASFGSAEFEDESNRRKVDSGVSFSSNNTVPLSSSNRNSAQSHEARASTSTNSSISGHSRKTSKEKSLPEKPLSSAFDDDDSPISTKPAGSTLERIAREIRRIRSRGDVRNASQPRLAAAAAAATAAPVRSDSSLEIPAPSLAKERKLRSKLSLKNLRSSSVLRERDLNSSSRPGSRSSSYEEQEDTEIPEFDVEEMKRRRMIWEAQQRKTKDPGSGGDAMHVDG